MSMIKVLIVDDSAMFRQMLSQILAADDEIEVVGTAIDPIFAMQKIMRDPPDVITLDVEMPRMDGLTFLQKLMKSYPIPVVMISSWTQKGRETTLRALEMGAVDFIAKPEGKTPGYLNELKTEIIAKVKNAAKVNLHTAGKFTPRENGDELENGVAGRRSAGRKIVAIGASTGGVVAVRRVISKLRPAGYSVLITLHMPPGFTNSFATQLGLINGWKSWEAADGQPVVPGNIYVAPGGCNMLVEKHDGAVFIQVKDCAAEDIYKPNVNKTFVSVAKKIGPAAVGVIMTGMGDDGASGLLRMKRAGAATIAQSQESCMVFGMPKRAIEAGAVDYIVALDQIAAKIRQLI